MVFFCLHVFFLHCLNLGARDDVCLIVCHLVCQCAWDKLFDPGGLPHASQDLAWCTNKHFSFSLNLSCWVNSPA